MTANEVESDELKLQKRPEETLDAVADVGRIVLICLMKAAKDSDLNGC